MSDMKNLVFDLDGTLIDSSSSILEGLRGAFAACARQPQQPLTPAVIGPPLQETLAQLAGSRDQAVLRPLAEAFKAHYDSAGYRLTQVFPGIPEMLASLAAAGYPLYLATNKRLRPTQLILEHLGWRELFRGVYALDGFDPPLADKPAMLRQVLNIHGLTPQTTLYIGDRHEDGAAAAANAMPFAFASWGYGGAQAPPPAWLTLNQPPELLQQLAATRA